jgi:uncharacterized protein YdeI (YjbR/CyaY-like superfamily)
MNEARNGLPISTFQSAKDWAAWLKRNHEKAPGVWIRFAKKASGIASVTYDEAVDAALCYGWIDGQKAAGDGDSWLQRFTPRGPRSIWSKINRERVARLSAAGLMAPAGEAAVARAKSGGQWEAAYDSQKTASIPPDFQAELDKSKTAAAFFATLNSTNRFAMLHRLMTAKKPETRAARIEKFIGMLKRKEKLYP